jgi:uncharacterized protein YbaP (TraB family)
LGTVHLGVSLDEALAGHVEVVDGARIVVLEIDASGVEPSALAEAGRLPAGERLDRIVGPTAFERLIEELGAEVPPELLRQLRPWVVLSALEEHRIAAVVDGGLPLPMDVDVHHRALAVGAPLRFLETPAQQVAAMNAIPDDVFADDLVALLDDLPNAGEDLSALLASYRAGDAERLEAMFFDPDHLREAPELHETLIVRRNEAWLPLLVQELRRGGAFVAVGLAHLLGRDGLLAGLRGAGLRIDRIGGPPAEAVAPR